MGCQKMKPIVHGLEEQFDGKIDVLYFDVSDKKYAAVQKKLKYRGTPQFVLLGPDGTQVREWTGVVAEAELKKAMESVLRESLPGFVERAFRDVLRSADWRHDAHTAVSPMPLSSI